MTMPLTPAVRIAMVRDILDFAEKFQPGTLAQVLATFPDDARAALEAGSRMGWYPIEHDHWVVDGIIAVLGKERAMDCWSASVLDMVDKPLLRTFISGMLRVVGEDPARIIGLLPKAWPLIYDNFCYLELSGTEPNQVTLAFRALAPELHEHPNYFVSWTGVLRGLFEIARVSGQVALTIAQDKQSAEARCSWA